MAGEYHRLSSSHIGLYGPVFVVELALCPLAFNCLVVNDRQFNFFGQFGGDMSPRDDFMQWSNPPNALDIPVDSPLIIGIIH